MGKRKKSEIDEAELRQMSVEELEGLLVDKQKEFVREYLIDKNGTKAAIRAGYKAGTDNHLAAVTASKLMRDPFVSAYRRALLQRDYQRLAVTREEICLEYWEIYRRCMAAVPVLEWNSEKKEYVESGTWKFDPKGATMALDKLAGLMGLKAGDIAGIAEGIEAFLGRIGGAGGNGGREY